MDEETKEAIRRIATALETIATALDVRKKQSEAGRKSAEARRAKHGTARPTSGTPAVARTTSRSRSEKTRMEGGGGTQSVVAAYCESYKARYGINPIIEGKTIGLAGQLCRSVPTERLRELVQAFLQMDDPWFKNRCHDFATFAGNLGKVAVALANGTQDPHERDYWRKVFGDGEGNVRGSIASNEGNLGGKELSSGKGGDLLEELPELF